MLIQSDYHIHASFYRLKTPEAPAGPTAAEQIAAARAAGSRYVGILEHCNMAKHHPFHCLEELSAEFHSPGFKRQDAFLGVEADLDDDGSDACGKNGREKLHLDYVIGSVHLSPARIPDVNTYLETEYRRIRNALICTDNVNVIGHPFGEGIRYERAGLVPKWGFHLIPRKWLDELIALAVNSGKALEINRCDPEDPAYRDFLMCLRDSGAWFSIGSDAHSTAGVEAAKTRTRWLESLGFQEEHHWRVKT